MDVKGQGLVGPAGSGSGHFERMIAGVRDYAIYLLSPTGLVRSWNVGAERIKGYAPEEIIGQHFSRFYTEEDRATDLPARALDIAVREGKFESEGWRVRKDGSRFWAHVVLDSLFDDSGQHVGYAKITRDITAQHEAKQIAERQKDLALDVRTREYHELLRLFEQAPGFVCFFRGPKHAYQLQNSAHHRLAGFRPIIGKPVREALPELEGQGFFELLDEVYETGRPFVGRAVPLRVDPQAGGESEVRFIDFVYQPIVDDDGAVVGVFSQGNDVTDQVHAQEALKRKQDELEQLIVERTEALENTSRALELAKELHVDNARLLRLFEQAPGFVCVLRTREHVFELANAAYRRLTGDRDLIGKRVRDAMPEVVEQGFIDLLSHVFDTGEPFVGKAVPVMIQAGDGGPLETRFLDFVYQPIAGNDGEVGGIFVQGQDVTVQKLAQDEVERYQTSLEALVEERTRELEQTQAALQRSQKLEAIGKLTGGIAHDFNNILQVIGGNLQLLSASVAGNETAIKRVDTAASAVERGAKLSSQLLAFARRQPLQPVVTNLAPVVAGMDDMLRRALGESVVMETVLAGGLWNVQVDPHQLENVVLNLAINARDAMPDGGKLTIELSNSMLDDDYVALDADLEPGQYVMLAISDTGTGMTREVMERACDPFFTTKPEGVGTGLGLSMAYGFVKQSGGHFKIYSEVGHGTTIKIYLPRSLEAVVQTTSFAAAPVVGGTETILVVEDDLAVQSTVVEMLRELGYQVLKADNAESALGILQSGLSIDLLFTDVVMPGKLRSPELARRAKALLPNIEVLFTSGYTQNAIVHGGRLDAGVQLLTKPYRREQLARKIRHMLANRKQLALARSHVPVESASPVTRLPQGFSVLVVEDHPELRGMALELIRALGHRVKAVASAEEALTAFAADHFDILFTDVGLPGMDGVTLSRRLAAERPGLRVIYATGYGQTMEDDAGAIGTVLAKPYTLASLNVVLAQFAEAASNGGIAGDSRE
ncbi:response regulator [Caballeronia sp. LZ062]|uniref:hybrid sensor histidine kinase/response regulator n=1 Tax=unclassified Caballeronia TaxID=2646786 RepID=UPI0028579D0F|nr:MULTISPECIES: response regulator [unclassified Caballeronia]MDR5856538.1 response regulator [Caballeronia sp. LZ050]MDR5873208.1 response regulator [Caballeronia sp. LZ062]